jgi:hypothetical protein
MKEDVGEQESARRATPSFLGGLPCMVGRFGGWGGACGFCRRCCCRLAPVNGGFASFGVRAERLVQRDLGEGRTGGSLAGGVKADFKRSVD